MRTSQFINSLFFVLTIASLASCTADHAELCDQPKKLMADHITYHSACVRWSHGGSEGTYEMQYKAMDSAVWKVQMCTADSFTIIGLMPLTSYQYRLIAHCGSFSSQVGTPAVFTTDSLTHSVYIPNTFSPNGDGVHDTFVINSNIINSADMQIYDRWGNKVYDSGTMTAPAWDGKYQGHDQPAGTYVYYVTLVYIDGYVEHRAGNIILMR